MKVAVVCHDIYHPAGIIRQGIEALNAPGVEWDFILDTTEWSHANFETYDIILLTKGNSRSDVDFTHWLTPEIEQGFVDFVEGGRSLLVIHSGTVGYKNQPVFLNLVGGVFARHPEQCDVTVETIDVAGEWGPVSYEATDPEAGPFTLRDEHYFVDLAGSGHEFFLKSTSTNGTQPAGWTRRQGAGRVCVLTPGHNVEVWLHPEYQRRIVAALNWCRGEDGR